MLAAGCLWGAIGLFSRTLAAAGLSPVQITEIRCIIVSLVMLGWLGIFDREKLRIRLRDIWMFLGTGIASIVFFNVCYFLSTELNTLAVASVLLYTAPCFVMFISAVVFREKLTPLKVAAAIAAFIGCAMTSGLFGGGERVSTMGLLAGIGSGFGYALYSIFGGVALKRYHPFTVTAYTFIVAALALAPFSGIVPAAVTVCGSALNIGAALGLGILSTLAPFLLYTKGLEKMEAGRAAVTAFIEPITATLIGVFVFREKLPFVGIMGIALIFAAIAVINLKKHNTKKDAAE